MKALLFAAGLGERMRPLTDTTPKPLLRAGGKPLVEWHIEKLAAIGIREIVVNTSWLAERFPRTLGDGSLTLRADWSYRDEMFGEPSSDPGRFTGIESRDLINFDITYAPGDGSWSVSAYGRNVTDERYDNARLNTNDYVLVIKSIDASEFGLRLVKEF